jgi:hypothetical protein
MAKETTNGKGGKKGEIHKNRERERESERERKRERERERERMREEKEERTKRIVLEPHGGRFRLLSSNALQSNELVHSFNSNVRLAQVSLYVIDTHDTSTT